MTELEWARLTMAFSLAFHIVFASISVVMPFFMASALKGWYKHGRETDRHLAVAWSKGVALLFATGAVSGTALSFQLGLLWPGFMEHAGPIIGMPFSLEGAAFFLEAIFLGLFLYGWNRLTPRYHLMSAYAVGLCGVASAVLVIAANAWMNSPAGFDWVNGRAENIDPIAAMFNSAWPMMSLHMTIASFQATGFAAAGFHAFALWRGKNSDFHQRALVIILPFAVVASLIQPIIGDLSAKDVAHRQPEKLAAMEAHFHTEKGADLIIGGWPNTETGEVNYALHLPKMLSFLATGDFNAEVKGLFSFPLEERPPVLITHLSFQTMVGLGTILALVSLAWIFMVIYKVQWTRQAWFLKLLVLLTPTGFIALEAGWFVTEVGRQPWIIYKVMKVSEAVTPVPGLSWVFMSILFLYFILGSISFALLWKIFTLEPTHREVSA